MKLEERVREFVALCEAGRTLEAIERFFAEDVVVFENHERARAGRAECHAYEVGALARLQEPAQLKARSWAVDEQAGVAFIEWVVRYVGDDGRPMRLEEVSVQRWTQRGISEERFYYEGVVDEGDSDEADSRLL